jgi:hypothetical protein
MCVMTLCSLHVHLLGWPDRLEANTASTTQQSHSRTACTNLTHWAENLPLLHVKKPWSATPRKTKNLTLNMDLDYFQNTTAGKSSFHAADHQYIPAPASRAERQTTGQLEAGGQVGGALNAAGLGRPGSARLLGTASARSIGARGAGGGLIAGSNSRLCAGANLGGALSALAGCDGSAEGRGNDGTHI